MSRGSTAFHNGMAAEDIAVRHYETLGGQVLARRWKVSEGEIDLVIDLDGMIVFVEVKSSQTLARALAALRPAQQARIVASAEQYLARHATLNTDCRFDLLAVDRIGRVEMLTNILAG